MVVLRVTQWVGGLDPVDDDPFARNPGLHAAGRLELIDPEPGLRHQVRDLGSDADGRGLSGGWGLVETDRVQVIQADAACMARDCGWVKPVDRRLRVGGRVHAAVECHLVEVTDVAAAPLAVGEARAATDVGEPGQHVHQLHRPRAELLLHDEAGEEATLFTRSCAGSTQHHDRGGVKAPVPQTLGLLLHVGVV